MICLSTLQQYQYLLQRIYQVDYLEVTGNFTNNFITKKSVNIMSQSILKARVLNYDPPHIQLGGRTPPKQHHNQFTFSKPKQNHHINSSKSLNKGAYLAQTPVRQGKKSQSVQRLTSKGKKRFLNVVSDPHGDVAEGIKQRSVQLAVSRGRDSRMLRKSRMVEESQSMIRKKNSLNSIHSYSMIIDGKSTTRQNTQRPTIIVKQRIVPVLIKSNSQNVSTHRLHIKDSQPDSPTTPINRLNPPYTAHHTSKTPQGHSARPQNTIIHTPIKSFIQSPSHPQTPIQITNKPKDIDRSNQLKCLIQLNQKLNIYPQQTRCVPLGNKNMNSHARAISFISDPQAVLNGPPAFRTIHKKQITQFKQNSQYQPQPAKYIQIAQVDSKEAQNKQKELPLQTKTQISFNTSQAVQSQNQPCYEHQHKIEKTEQPKTTQIKKQNSGRKEQRGPERQHRRSGSIKHNRINSFFDHLNEEMENINSQRITTQGRIEKRIQELSQRANSLVRLHSQSSRKSPQTPTHEQTILQFANSGKKRSMVTQTEVSQHRPTCQSNYSQINSLNPMRKQILNRIFS